MKACDQLTSDPAVAGGVFLCVDNTADLVSLNKHVAESHFSAKEATSPPSSNHFSHTPSVKWVLFIHL